MPFLQPLNCEKVKFHAFFGKGGRCAVCPSAKADGRMGGGGFAAAGRIRLRRMRRAARAGECRCERRRFAANLGIAGIPKAAECANLHLTASKRRPPEGNSPPLCSANRLGSPPRRAPPRLSSSLFTVELSLTPPFGEQRGACSSAKADGHMRPAAKPPPAAFGEAECGAPRVRGNVGANGGVLLRIWVLRGYQKPPSVRICT